MDAQATSEKAIAEQGTDVEKTLLTLAFGAWEQYTDEIVEGRKRLDTTRFNELYGIENPQAPLTLMFETFAEGFIKGLEAGAKLKKNGFDIA